MKTSNDRLKAARARAGQQEAAIAYQRAVGQIVARLTAAHRFGPGAIIAALDEAGIKPSRGTEWTPQAVQGVRARIQARCAACPEFRAEVESWRPARVVQSFAERMAVSEQSRAAAEARIREAARQRDEVWRLEHQAARAAEAALRDARRAELDRERQARRDARKEAAEIARQARRALKSEAAVQADIRLTTAGRAAASEVARAARERIGPAVEAVLARGLPLAHVAAELNRLGVPRLRGGAGWTKAAVCQFKARSKPPMREDALEPQA